MSAEKDFWIDPDPDKAPGVLLSDRISFYCKNDKINLIHPFEEDENEGLLRPANYDLRVGNKYYLNSEEKEISEKKPLIIEPNQFVHVETYETLNIPFYMIGVYNLRTKQTMRGFLMGTGLQVDSGYKGKIYVVVYNFTDEKRHLDYKEKLISIQFLKTTPFGNDFQNLDNKDIHEIYSKEFLIEGINGNKCYTFGDGNVPINRNFKSYLHEKDTRLRSSVFELEKNVNEMKDLKGEVTKELDKTDQKFTKKINFNLGVFGGIVAAVIIGWSVIFIDWKGDHLRFTETLATINNTFLPKDSSQLGNMAIDLKEQIGSIKGKLTGQEKEISRFNENWEKLRIQLVNEMRDRKKDIGQINESFKILEKQLILIQKELKPEKSSN